MQPLATSAYFWVEVARLVAVTTTLTVSPSDTADTHRSTLFRESLLVLPFG